MARWYANLAAPFWQTCHYLPPPLLVKSAQLATNDTICPKKFGHSFFAAFIVYHSIIPILHLANPVPTVCPDNYSQHTPTMARSAGTGQTLTSGELTVRSVQESDLEAVRTLFYRSYGDSYPYKEFYNDKWLKRSIYNDSYLFLLAELAGKVVGTASIYYEVGAYADLCGEFGRLAVDPDIRGYGIGSALMEARLAFASKRLHFGLAECRTAHPFAQRISEKHGLRPIGFLPQKVLLQERESLVLMGKTFGQAARLRRNNPRVIPEIFLLGQLALQNLGFEIDLIAVDDAESYPIGSGFEVEQLNEFDLYSLLRIERGRLWLAYS